MIKAVLFDLGGVYFEDGTVKFIKKLSKKTGLEYDKLYELFRTGKSLDYRKNLITADEFFKWASAEIKHKVLPDDLNLMWVSEYTEIREVKDIVVNLRSNGLKVTILSDNVPERIDYLQKKYGFLDLFDDVVLSYEVNLTKSSVEIFKLALGRINIKPAEAVFVDDSQKKLDVAKTLGIATILFSDRNKLASDLEKVISSNKSK